ncbi:hypothetical protein BaRGS_00032197 [Batillaria attramentaria]|uniref:Uncharacterized protein n=1 Tax=Batillaria attramentaria TaxID=370345 RepID=A0ABD0JP06_9CAEN
MAVQNTSLTSKAVKKFSRKLQWLRTVVLSEIIYKSQSAHFTRYELKSGMKLEPVLKATTAVAQLRMTNDYIRRLRVWNDGNRNAGTTQLSAIDKSWPETRREIRLHLHSSFMAFLTWGTSQQRCRASLPE